MEIAVIDTGIDTSHKRLKDCTIRGISIYSEDKLSNDYFDNFGHGTGCAGIIHKIIPEAVLVGVKIFSDKLITQEYLLIKAIEWCLSQKEIRIINISLGISGGKCDIKLAQICHKAYEMNKAIVAAAHNDINVECYPAYYPNVISVLAGKMCKSTEWGCSDYERMEFIAKGSIQRVAWKDGEDNIVTGTSFAAPHLTGIIGKFLHEDSSLSVRDIAWKLKNGANNNIQPLQFGGRGMTIVTPRVHSITNDSLGNHLFNNNDRFNWVKRLGIFPVSEKEMKQFIDFPDLCKYPINLMIDYPTLLKKMYSNGCNIIRKIPDDKEFEEIDTLVLGYFNYNLWEGNIEFGKRLLNLSIEKRKNFFVYDKRIYKVIANRIVNEDSKVYIPEITESKFEDIIKFKYLPEVRVPIVVVIGTSNKQGKFTTQLRLKKVLETEGYNVSHISTEPQGELFGADFAFPTGYMSTVELSWERRITCLRTILKGIHYFKKPDLIITGIQGGLIPRKPLSSMPYLEAISSLSYLYGILPDLIICAINPQDTVEIIENTITAARIYTKCKCILFVMTPWYRDIHEGSKYYRMLPEKEKEERLNYFQQKLEAPVIDVMDKSNDQLILKQIENAC